MNRSLDRAPQGVIRPYMPALDVLFRLSDAGIIFFALYAQTWLRGMNPERQVMYVLPGLIAVLAFVLFGEVAGLYRIWRGNTIGRECQAIVKVWIWVIPAILLAGYFFKISAFYSRQVILVWFVLAPALMCGWRWVMRSMLARFRRKGLNTRRTAIYGEGNLAHRVEEVILSQADSGFRLVGRYADDSGSEDKPVAGTLQDLVALAREGKVDHVYATVSLSDSETCNRMVRLFADTTAQVFIVPDLWLFDMLHSRWSQLGDLPVINVYDTPAYGVNSMVKRLFDLVVGSGLLLFLSPLIVCIALAVRLTSRGPVLFRQRRYGLDGREFRVWKFRTMTVAEDGDHVLQAVPGDRRVTPLGHWLRKTSLDELPQLLNVLSGTMSLVGPRPHAVAHNQEYRDKIEGYMLRHRIKPGMTGLAQVRGYRGVTDTIDKMEKRIESDLEYIRNWSLLLDIHILIRTALCLFRDPNAC